MPRYQVDNVIRGTNGNDDLHGTSLWDYIIGGKGDDTLQGHGGSDVLEGGDGADTFVIESNSSQVIITDLSHVEGDVVVYDNGQPLDPLFSGSAYDGFTVTTDVGLTFGFYVTDADADNHADDTWVPIIDGNGNGSTLFIINLTPGQLTGDMFLGG